ncbi:hypothetical protein LCGC14_1645350 [marine sediment metagenome]|uniref:HNH nuclease domain-containing protein n=1 Tax=marine sediment metagenome TaxID=412755 RepID=A0A0F9IKY0_9ZZZZ
MKLSQTQFTCGICQQPILPEDEVHKDHIIPKSKGGPAADWNLRLVHSSCNLRRHTDIEIIQLPMLRTYYTPLVKPLVRAFKKSSLPQKSHRRTKPGDYNTKEQRIKQVEERRRHGTLMAYDSLRKLTRNVALRDYAASHPGLSQEEIGQVFGISASRVSRLLKVLRPLTADKVEVA